MIIDMVQAAKTRYSCPLDELVRKMMAQSLCNCERKNGIVKAFWEDGTADFFPESWLWGGAATILLEPVSRHLRRCEDDCKCDSEG